MPIPVNIKFKTLLKYFVCVYVFKNIKFYNKNNTI